MSRTECFRLLGVDSDASFEAIRQAYKDLVRVWHPDRFQSDPELQRRAEQQLQRINEAYLAIKNSQFSTEPQPDPAPQPQPAEPAPPVHATPPSRGPDRPAWNLHYGWTLRAAWLGLVCLAPLVIGSLLLGVRRVPTLESLTPQGGPSTPGILMPSRFVSPFGDRPATADELSSWARDQARDIWKSLPKIGQSDDVVPRELPRRPDPATVTPDRPENGTELLRTRMSGGSELWILNPGNQDAVARLVESDTTASLRVVYIQAKSRVCIRHIAPGIYDLLAETGEDWDPAHLRFQNKRRALARTGPYQCMDVISSQGTYGPKFHIALGSR